MVHVEDWYANYSLKFPQKQFNKSVYLAINKRLDFSNTVEYKSQGGSTKKFRIPQTDCTLDVDTICNP